MRIDTTTIRGRQQGTMRRVRRLRRSVCVAVAAAVSSLTAVSAAEPPSSPARPARAYATLDDWIGSEAVPFSLDSPARRDAAVDNVVASLGELDLLGFTEPMHGSEEILILRNQFFQRLVEAHGYSAIAIESAFPEGQLVDAYVAGAAIPYEDVAKSVTWGFGRLEANRELIEWMRRYNADPAHKVKLRFYGFDISAVGGGSILGPDKVLHLALDYLASIDGERARAHRERIDALLAQLSGWENPQVWIGKAKAPGSTPAAASLRLATEDLINELHTRRPELVARSDRDRYLLALQYAQIARQTLNFHTALARTSKEPPGGVRSIRDSLMADNLAYIVERERGRGKVFAFAGQGHLQRGKAVWPCCGIKFGGTDVYEWWPAGEQLNLKFGSRYAVIGTAVGVSKENGIAAPEAGSFEARLSALPGPALFIPTHRGQGLPAQEIASIPVRSGSELNQTYMALLPEYVAAFDWWGFVDSSTYNRGGPSLQSWGTESAKSKPR